MNDVSSFIMFGMPGPSEILIVLLIVLVLFGGSKLPEIGKYMGKGISEFKKAMRDSSDDEKKD